MNPETTPHLVKAGADVTAALTTLFDLSNQLEAIAVNLHLAGWKSYEDDIRPRFTAAHHELFTLLAQLHIAFTVDEVIARQDDGSLAHRKYHRP